MQAISIEGGVTAAQGFLASGMYCGIRKNKSKPDLALIYSKVPCAAAAVYTQNLVKGAPIQVTRRNIADGIAQAVICNSGNEMCIRDRGSPAQTPYGENLYIAAWDYQLDSSGERCYITLRRREGNGCGFQKKWPDVQSRLQRLRWLK